MKRIYTAIFGPYDELKEPTVITPGWQYVCFTDQPLKSKVWEVINVQLDPDQLVYGPIRIARFYKLKVFQYFDVFQSMWIDASFTINCDLNTWWDTHFVSPFTCISHPIRNCVYEEGAICIKNKRGVDDQILEQIREYARQMIPARNGLISSGILMRERTVEVGKLCDQWFDELMQHSTRDQLAFAAVIYRHPIPVHYITWDYRIGTEFKWLTHIHRRK